MLYTNTSTTSGVTYESLMAAMKALPPLPRPEVTSWRCTAAELTDRLREAGITQDRPWEPFHGIPFSPLRFLGLAIEEVPHLGITLVGPDDAIREILGSPPALSRAVATAKGITRTAKTPLSALLG